MTSAFGLSVVPPSGIFRHAQDARRRLRLLGIAGALVASAACTDAPPLYTEAFDSGRLSWTASCNKNHADDSCAEGRLDKIQFQLAGPSARLHQRGSCLTPPPGGVPGVPGVPGVTGVTGVTSFLSETLEIPNGTYRLSYGVRNTTRHYSSCGGVTSGGTSMVANDVHIDGVACDVGQCGTCTVDWTARQGCFNVTKGTVDLLMISRSGDCAETDGWVDDIAITPLEPLEVQFPADIRVARGDSLAPAATGTVSVIGGCDPQVSHTDAAIAGCSDAIMRAWKVVDAGVRRTQVQIITVQAPSVGEDAKDADRAADRAIDTCSNTPTANLRTRICEQRVKLACPLSATWRSRDAYASCVSEAANLCVDEGLLGEFGAASVRTGPASG